jgi:uncharacterized protein YfaP (DUF2135 family)
VSEDRVFTITLTGGTPGAVLSGAANTLRTGEHGTLLLENLAVDRAGTGYQLEVSSNGLPTILSAPFDVTAPGSFSGRVFDAVTNSALSGASVEVRTDDGTTIATATSGAPNGTWTATGVGPGTYTIRASKPGYVVTTLAMQTMTPPTTVVEPIPLVPMNTPGGISGNIRDASTTALVTSPVTVELRLGINMRTGTIAASVVTSTGSFTFTNVAAGAYTIVARATGFVEGVRTGIVVGAGTTVTQQDVQLSTTVGAARIVLTRGISPSDLDSHLTGPVTGSSSRFWVYYSNRGSTAASPFARLDVDDTNGNGPETITLGAITSGVYRYYVYDYTNRNSSTSASLGNSGAQVQFFVGSTLRATFFVPNGVGNAWAVFEWDGIFLSVLNNLYTISGVPMPARLGAGTGALDGTSVSVEDELRLIFSRLPVKPQPR